jgi:PAS domain S-box-containing protein
MTRLSLANRLRIGLALMLALMVAGYLLALRQAPPDASGFTRALARSEAAQRGVAAMQSSTDAIRGAVDAFTRDADAKHLQSVAEADAQFAAGLKRYGAALGRDGQALVAQLSERQGAYTAQAKELLNPTTPQEHAKAFVEYQQRTLHALLTDLPEATAAHGSSRSERKHEASLQVRRALEERAAYYKQAEEPKGAMPDTQELSGIIARYQAFADTPAERAWAERATRALRDASQQAGAIATADRNRAAALEKLQAAQEALQAVLTSSAQKASGPDLSAPLEQANQAVRLAQARFADVLLLLLGAALLVALLTLHAVRAPLRRLAASTRAYVGDLSFLSIASPGDEVAELEWALTRLKDRISPAAANEEASSGTQSEELGRLRRAAFAFEHSQHAILLTDERLGTQLVNPAFTELTGYAPDDVKGAAPSLLWSPDHYDSAAVAAVWAEVDEHGRWQGEVAVRTKSGDVRPAVITIDAVRDAQGVLQHAVLTLADRAALRADTEPLEAPPAQPLQRDVVSTAVRGRLAEAIALRTPDAPGIAILRLYVPTLRGVGEALGDTDAQQMLAEVGARVKVAVGERGEVLDNDGHEPLVLVPQVADAEQLARIAHDIVRGLSAAPVRFSGLELPLSASVGIARTPGDGDSADTLIAEAGAAMERVKGERGGAFAFASEPLTAQMRDRMALEDDLLSPALTEQLVLHYQPLLALRSAKAVGVEALLRWRHPARGLLGPDAFMAQAQRAGVLPDIGGWVMRTACVQAMRWIDSGLPALRVALNLSRAELDSEGLVRRVQRALDDSGLDPHLLQLEVSEDSLDGARDLSPTLVALHELGVTLTLSCERDSDVAGSALTWLPFTRIKLDAPLRPQEAGIAPGILALARSLSVCVVAERVESEAQASALRAQAIDELQGFLIGRPVAAREFELRMRHASGKAPAVTAAAGAS